MQSRREWKVGERGDIIVREINGVLVLHNPAQPCSPQYEDFEYREEEQTFATPKFSIAGILCPIVLVHDINGARHKV